ncbi:MAG: hemerythrin domain-containing protein [Deltaproteobacteria bacterium]|nr:hemerythrin domain-containing protein [Deltaproteobacteria bacterium]MBV9524856.1 hemerythrin domain-containing protein [Candidatus Dormibacteraeota bacterium]
MAQTALYNTDTSDMYIPHGLFRTVFTTSDGIITSVDGSETERVTAVHSYFDNVLRFLDAHHGGEDAIVWPVLSERCADAAGVIGRMEGEHATIHQLRDRAGEALAAWQASATPANGDALSASLSALHSKVDEHFAEEEAEVLPLASQHMSPEEWGALPGHAMQHFSGDKIWLILGLVFEQMTPEQLTTTFALLPPPVIDMWKSSGNVAFDEFMRQVRPTA